MTPPFGSSKHVTDNGAFEELNTPQNGKVTIEDDISPANGFGDSTFQSDASQKRNGALASYTDKYLA